MYLSLIIFLLKATQIFGLDFHKTLYIIQIVLNECGFFELFCAYYFSFLRLRTYSFIQKNLLNYLLLLIITFSNMENNYYDRMWLTEKSHFFHKPILLWIWKHLYGKTVWCGMHYTMIKKKLCCVKFNILK